MSVSPRWICSGLLVFCLLVPAHGADLKLLLDQGAAALVAGDDDGAKTAFEQVLADDPANARALAGAALAHARSNSPIKARKYFDRAVAADPSRSTLLNAAAFHLTIDQPMRSAKLLSDWLSAHPQPLDPPMIDAFAVALSQVDSGVQRLSIFATYEKQYLELNAALEAAYPGHKRWGTQWLDSAEADRRAAERDKAQQSIDRVKRVNADLYRRLQQAQRDLDDLADKARRGFATEFRVRRARVDVERIQDQIAVHQREIEEFQKAAAPPTFPKSIPYVGLDDNTPPPVGDARPAPRDAQKPAIPATRAGDPGIGDLGFGDDPTPTPPAHPTPPPQTPTPPSGTAPSDDSPADPTPPNPIHRTAASVAVAVAPDLLLCASTIDADGKSLQVQSTDGTPLRAVVVRTDRAAGLTLLRIDGKKLNYIGLSDPFQGGAITCPALVAETVFQPTAEVVAGTAEAPAERWTVRLDKHPRLPGAPLLAGGRIVGIELAAPGIDPAAIPAATVTEIRRFLGPDAPSRSPAIDSDGALFIYQVAATITLPQ